MSGSRDNTARRKNFAVPPAGGAACWRCGVVDPLRLRSKTGILGGREGGGRPDKDPNGFTALALIGHMAKEVHRNNWNYVRWYALELAKLTKEL